MKFEVKAHGNRNRNNLAHFRTKKSTKDVMAESLNSREQKGLSLKRLKKPGEKASQKDSSVHKDPLASVLELQKSTFPGFIQDVTSNDLPTVTLFTDHRIDNLIKFCCHSSPGWVSELGVDVTFQLRPFYFLVTTFRNTMLEAKQSLNAPAFPGPLMICMTKDQSTYLSFVHRLLREVPGLS